MPNCYLQYCLEIGADDSLHTADLCVMHKVVNFDAPPLTVQANRFHCRIKTNFVSKLEAVGERLLRTVDVYTYAIELLYFNTLRERLTGEAVSLDWRVVESGFLGATRQRHMNLVGYLCGELMKRQCGNQADHATGNSGRNGDQVRISQRWAIAETIQPTADHHQHTGVAHGVKRTGVDAGAKSLSRAHDSPLFLEGSDRPVEPGTLVVCVLRLFHVLEAYDSFTYTSM